MESGGSGSCSTDLEASGSSVSEQYNEDDFDDYSDSLEEEGSGATSTLEVSAASGAGALCVGTRVQVLWREENEWFDGAIQRVEEGNEPRYYVLYDDGEQQWESAANTRPLPAAITSTAQCYDQLQQLRLLSSQSARALIGRRAAVYWPDKLEWYSGVVGAAQTSPPALKIDYDDGDCRWEQEYAFNCILPQREELEAPLPPPTNPGPALTSGPPSPPARVLYARPYRQAVSDHFQPVRIARPYRCAVEKHSESVLIPRRSYSERRYLHTVHEALQCDCFTQRKTSHSLFPETVDSIAQTALPSCSTEP